MMGGMTDTPARFRDYLKARRNDLGLTPAEVARTAGLVLSTYAQLERGTAKGAPRDKTLRGLDKALGLPAGSLQAFWHNGTQPEPLPPPAPQNAPAIGITELLESLAITVPVGDLVRGIAAIAATLPAAERDGLNREWTQGAYPQAPAGRQKRSRAAG
jgi:transcriptional regulator with XRE-family HTH domain